jgi:SAM dependent carboxyl methyltransferase
MIQDSTVPKHTAMQGGGFYNKNSALQASGISLLLPLWTAICQNVACVGEPLVIVDYASSQGRNSMAPMKIAIDALKRRNRSDTPVEVIHTDLPDNDFSALFHALQDNENSYMAGSSNVYPAAIGRNYFQSLFAPDRVHLGWNTFSMQWLSRISVATPDHILSGLSQNDAVVAAVKKQLDDDWRSFLKLRAGEMRVGAKLLTAFTGKMNGVSGWEWLCGELWGALKDMGQGNRASAEEIRKLSIPIAFRTQSEIEAPFAESGRFAGLELDHVEYMKIPDPFWAEYQTTMDQNIMAQRHADLTRAWAAPTLMGCIAASPDKTRLIEELFQRFATRIALNPKQHEPWMAVVVVKKVISGDG